MKENYSAVILAYGASKDRLLGLENEFSQGVYPSRRVVNWYNGSLDNDLETLDLNNIKDVTVIGNGNIFCDIARVLLKSEKDLAQTDIPKNVLEQLKDSSI